MVVRNAVDHHESGTLTLGRRGECGFYGKTARAEVSIAYFLCTASPLMTVSVLDPCECHPIPIYPATPTYRRIVGADTITIQDEHRSPKIIETDGGPSVSRTRGNRSRAGT